MRIKSLDGFDHSKYKDLDETVCKYLYLKGIKNQEEMESKLFSKKLTNSNKLSDIQKITARIKEAIACKEKIVVYGDYDVDGSIATAILLRYFKEINYPIDYYIPHRITEGYGLNLEAIEKLSERGCKILISVDNGITAFDAAKKAKEVGIDLIITDHHDLSAMNELPDAYAILNPKRDNIDSCKFLCGAGVAFFLINQLNRDLGMNVNLKKYLVLAMIASVADVVPLIYDNRVIVKYGLEFLKKEAVIGLKMLLEALNIKGTITAKDIGFRIGPILNAAGRIEGAEKTIKFLIEDDEYKAHILVHQLLEINKKRRKMSDEAIEKHLNSVDNSHNIIVVADTIHPGIIGILAAKIKEKYNKPTIVIGLEEGKPIGKASCRSVPGINIKDVVDFAREYHLGGGGHYMAAGFSIREDQIEEFRQRVYLYEDIVDEQKEYDLDLTIDNINKKFITDLESLEPFGAVIENPVVKYTGEITDLRILKDQHLLIKLDKKVTLLIFFSNLKVDLIEFKKGKRISVFGELSVSQNDAKIIKLNV